MEFPQTIIYLSPLLNIPTKCIWKVHNVNDVDQKIYVVKFVESYCLEAHKICAETQLSPMVHYFDQISGGYFMLVMDYVEGSTLDQCIEYFRDNRSFATTFFEDITKAITLLHNSDYVFADLRPPNIIVTKDNCNRAVLVDFDWCGESGHTRYPFMMNLDIPWPPHTQGVYPGAFLQKNMILGGLSICRWFCI